MQKLDKQLKELKEKLDVSDTSIEAYKRKVINFEGRIKVYENQISYKDKFINVLNDKIENEGKNFRSMLEEHTNL